MNHTKGIIEHSTEGVIIYSSTIASILKTMVHNLVAGCAETSDDTSIGRWIINS